MAFSLFVVFLYGSLVWGLLPIDPSVSFEGHLAGGFSGVFFAWYYRKLGPQAEPIKWEEEDMENDSSDDEWMRVQNHPQNNEFEVDDAPNPESDKVQPIEPRINFIYTEKTKEKPEEK